jgi:chromosome segregation ATPase
MPPDMLILAVSAVAGLLLVLGGVFVGRGMASGAQAGRSTGSSHELEMLRNQLRDAERIAGELRQQNQSIRQESEADFEKRVGILTREHTNQLSKLRADLDEARGRSGGGGPASAPADVKATLEALSKQRDEAFAKIKELESRPVRSTHPSESGASGTGDRELKTSREELERLRGELQRQDQKIEKMKESLEKETAEKDRVTKERDESRERQEAVERIMEGVRARSTMLSQQLKDAQAELAKLKS